MLKTRATFLLFLVVVLAVQIFAQESERWNIPFTKLQPNKEAVTQGDVQPVRVNTSFNNNPIRTVTKDNTYVVFPNVIPVPNPNGTQSEVHIAINPVNPNILLGGSNAANTAVTYLNQGWYVTTNGGTSWYGNDSLPPPPGSNYRSDPVVGFDLFGNMYFNTLDYGSSTGDVVTMKSTNNGQTWTKYTIPNPGLDEDKNWFAVDITQSSAYKNYMYTSWVEFQSTDPNYRKLEFSRSTDLGVTWSNPVRSSTTDGYLHQGVNLTTGPEGQVYAAYSNYVSSALTTSNVDFFKSTDGGLTFTYVRTTPTPINDIRGNLTKGGNTIRVNSFPYIACDRSNGSRKGHIYVTWAARAATGQAPDVYLTKSTDQGATWSTPKRVNADTALTNRDQWFPAVAVDPADGSVNIVYYDSRNFAANDSAEVYLSRSVDGGNTFEDIKISTSAHKPQSISGLATGYQGDYIGIDARNGIVWPIWNDNRTGKHQAYVAKVFFIQILHPPLGNTESLAGPYKVGARITASNPIGEAKVYWRRGTSGAFDSLIMTNVASTDSFYANIPGNGSNATYQYYIYAKDNVGAFATLPGDAPSTLFSFTAATDVQPPVVTHTVIGNQYREQWPVAVNANVTDNIGVDSVRVNYKINYNGTPRQFYLTKVGNTDNYTGNFNVDTSLTKVGDTIYYRITARDKAAAANYGYHPTSTTFNTFRFIADTSKAVITHVALGNQPKIRWPATVSADVVDNIRVDSVWVEWYKNTTANAKRFNLTKGTGNTWSGLFNSDTLQVAVGDSIFYRVVARDGSTNRNITYLPETGRFKFNIIQTKGLVLVIDDDAVLADRMGNEKGRVTINETDEPLGASATLFKTVLDSVGYMADLVTFAAFDTTTLNTYDIVILSAGLKSSSVFNDQGKRDAIRNFANKPNKKTWVEGGEVGYAYRSTGTLDNLFRAQVLHTREWVSDVSSSTLTVKDAAHPINNGITGPIGYNSTSIYARDAMKVEPGAAVYPTNAWSATPDSGGVIVYDKNPNPLAADGVFYTFNVALISDLNVAAKLIANTADYLVANEPAPTGGVAGTVTLTGGANNANARVFLSMAATPTVIKDSVITGNAGTYSFTGLYPGRYRVTVYPPTGYTPVSKYTDTTIATTVVNGINFTFASALPTTLTGTVTVQGAPDNSGVLVSITNQPGKTATTNAAGLYTISNIIAGPINVSFMKQGYRSVTKDTTINNGQTMTLNTTMIPGIMVLLIDDDAVLEDRINLDREGASPEKFDITSPLGASATLIKSALDSAGFVTDLVTFAAFDTTTLNNYALVILSAGTKTATIFNDAAKRAALANWAQLNGKKILTEGGEVGYFFRTSDVAFRDNVLHFSTWVTDATTSALMIKLPSHPINAGVPDNLSLTGTGYGYRDGLKVQAGVIAYPASTWNPSYTDTSAILVFDKTPSPISADAVFMSFALAGLADQVSAKKLIINAATYLTTMEAPPTGSIAGTITVTGAANNANARVYLSKTAAPTVILDSVITGNAGTYQFSNLYAGAYRVTAVPPTGWIPLSSFKDTTVGTGPVTNVNFTFTQIATTTLQGTVTVTGAPNNGGVTVTVVGQAGKTTTTSTTGAYTITGLTPGNIKVTFVKTGYKNVVKDTTISNGQTLTLNVTMVAGTNEYFFDFETDNGGFLPTNDWTWGTPTKTGAPVPYSGTKAWATKLDVNYTNGIKSELKSIPLNLAGFTNVTLSFWHWYEIEAKTVDTTSYDGGNLKVSSDNGVTWTLVTPAGGYPSRIDYTGNPMNGEKCYAGSKMFWQLAEFNLNAFANQQILVRFDFGTDASVNKIGWFIDDLKIEDKLLLVAPKNLTSTGGFNKKVSLTWQAPLEEQRPSINNSLSNASSQEEMDKLMNENNGIIPSIKPQEPKLEYPAGFLGYRIYRKSVFDATYGSHIAQVGQTTTAYVDTPVVNDTIYTYIVKALYDEGLSNPTNEVVAGAYIVPDTVLVNKSTAAPVIDGVVNPSEWSEAKVTNLTLAGIGGKMWTKYDTLNRKFYIAVINYKDKTNENYDQIGIYFDNDKSGTWAADTSEGNYWIVRVADTTQIQFRGIVGSTPTYVTAVPNPAGIKAKIGNTGGFVSYEVEINQATAKFTGTPGEWAGIWAYCANGNGSTSTNTGLWPEAAVFSNPATFGSIKFPGSIAPITSSVSVATGWNLVSVPIKLNNMAPTSVFPTATSKAFYYLDATGYVKADTMKHGLGYWLKFPGATNVNVTGIPAFNVNVPVVAGWNLIGALHGQFPVSGISSQPAGIIASSFFDYTGGVYNVVTNIDKGKGFWVRCNAAGTLKLGVGTLLAKDVNTYNEAIQNNWPAIVITDANGVQGRLYLSSKTSIEGKYELPPLPPTGVSDIRFANNKYVDDASNGQHIVNMNSLTYPVTIRIENTEENFRVKDLVGGLVVNNILKSGSSVQISNSAVNGISVETVVLPEKFELSQNYPNPFNPATRIKFAIPEKSVVKLQVFNALGEKVAELINRELEAGYYDMSFDASTLASGVYIYRIEAGSFNSVKKMMLVK